MQIDLVKTFLPEKGDVEEWREIADSQIKESKLDVIINICVCKVNPKVI